MDELINKAPQVLGATPEGDGATAAVKEGEAGEEIKGWAEAAGKEPEGGDNAPANTGWTGNLDEDLRDDPSITKFKTPNDLAKSYKNLESKLGKDKILAPKDDWTEKEWGAFYKASGRPDTHDGYQLTSVELPEGMTLAEDNSAFQQMAFNRGLNQAQADGLYKDWVAARVDDFNSAKTTAEEARTTASTELRKEWGAKYEKNLKLAERTFMENASEELKAAFNREGWGNNPDMIKLFAKLGQERSEDTIGETLKTEGLLTPDEAQAKINKVMGDKKNPYWNKEHPEHQGMQDQMDGWFKMAHPENNADVIND